MVSTTDVLIVEAPYYADIADELVRGAEGVLSERNLSSNRIEVPGAFELPAAVRWASQANMARGFIVLGCVIRGETDHYDHVCRETSRALMDMTVDRGIALGFGLLTCETIEQARARADVTGKNKGREAALACVRMLDLQRIFTGELADEC